MSEKICGNCEFLNTLVGNYPCNECGDNDNFRPIKKETNMNKIQFDSEEFRAILKDCMIASIAGFNFTYNKESSIDKTIEMAIAKGYIKKSKLELAREKLSNHTLPHNIFGEIITLQDAEIKRLNKHIEVISHGTNNNN